jgi:coproporphyrinogen III oxidase
MDLARATNYFADLQERIVRGLEAIDGLPFRRDAWQRPEGGAGLACIIEEGRVFERGGVNFSHVKGERLPPSATVARPKLAGRGFEVMGVSLVLHPRNPYAPTVHMNVRLFAALPKPGDKVAAPHSPPIWWFGGGMDLTPYYGFEEDAVHFHATCRAALASFGAEYHPRFKRWCDEYFFLKHRNEPRGVGGIFYDNLDSGDREADFAFTRDVGLAFLEVYPRIVRRHMNAPWTPEQRRRQLIRRGRYVEFNLLYDRGTLFGLKTGGNIEAILMSLPPEVMWP